MFARGVRRRFRHADRLGVRRSRSHEGRLPAGDCVQGPPSQDGHPCRRCTLHVRLQHCFQDAGKKKLASFLAFSFWNCTDFLLHFVELNMYWIIGENEATLLHTTKSKFIFYFIDDVNHIIYRKKH